ncbi:hypothetical protein [Megamonas funiformis]|uniref:hypothetical protein n=1 Tax=Megamonas funiformis TaxID=437897 RepID=UPI000E4860D5|nr:hypothetical protein [Megamonas funiformis]RGW51130.1 hypothetical protein DWV74_00035 [Megamonas funiformis]
MEYKFNFIGYQNYPHQVLFDFFYMYFKDNEKAAFFMVAITEAICNACRYNKKSYDRAKIDITIKYINKSLIVSIKADIYKTKAKMIKDNLFKLTKNNNACWHEIIQDKFSGRGIWLMLQSCDRVILEPDMQTVHLVVYLPYKIRKLSNKKLLNKLDIGVLEI